MPRRVHGRFRALKRRAVLVPLTVGPPRPRIWRDRGPEMPDHGIRRDGIRPQESCSGPLLIRCRSACPRTVWTVPKAERRIEANRHTRHRLHHPAHKAHTRGLWVADLALGGRAPARILLAEDQP